MNVEGNFVRTESEDHYLVTIIIDVVCNSISSSSLVFHRLYYPCIEYLFSLMVLLLMSFHVQSKMIRPREASVAMNALERFCTGVFPVMSCQLVRSCKTPFTALPHALVRLLTCENKSKRRKIVLYLKYMWINTDVFIILRNRQWRFLSRWN